MARLLGTAASTIAALCVAGCGQTRTGGELRLRHVVTIATAAGERSSTSVLSLDGYQTWNSGFGSSGWGGITCRLTGDAIRATVNNHDFLFLLSSPRGSTPAWTQIGLVKMHFGLPNMTQDASWVGLWKALAGSGRGFDLSRDQIPVIAVMPHNGWIDDARIVSLEEAEQLGLHIVRYRLEITRDPVGASSQLTVRYRITGPRTPPIEVGREMLTVRNATA